MHLDILSDPICPWCYIGKAHLDRALAERPDHGLEIRWHPFQLNPTMPREGMDRRAYLEAKFGAEPAARFYAQIAEAARAAGLEVDFERIGRTPSTLDAHRLIHWAGLEGCQSAVVDRLFRAYFAEGRDIGRTEELVAIAGEVGMDREMVRRLLASDADVEEIRFRDAWAREKGVDGVPTFIIADRYVARGAQPHTLWLKVIDELRAQIETGDGGAA